MKKKIGLILGVLLVVIALTPSISAIEITKIDRKSPSNLIPGDLIFMDYTPTEIMINNLVKNIRSNDHVVLYIGEREGYPGLWCVSAGLTRTEKEVDYVDLSTYLDTELVTNLTIARVITATESQRNAAITWITHHVGDSFQHWGIFPPKGGPQKCWNPTSLFFPFTRDTWYCSEIVWAAYYNQGIDIDANNWGLLPWMLPSVNMGVPSLAFRPDWLANLLIIPYAYYNEIQIDNDIQLISWT